MSDGFLLIPNPYLDLEINLDIPKYKDNSILTITVIKIQILRLYDIGSYRVCLTHTESFIKIIRGIPE